MISIVKAIILLFVIGFDSAISSSINEGVCHGVYIDSNNTSPEIIKKLRDCEIIDGSVTLTQLSLKTSELSFSRLREISGFLRIDQVDGVLSLKNLFPKLSVIRGQVSYKNSYALHISANKDLEEIGLVSLKHVSKDDVQVWGNPKLCYVDTINWRAMITSGAKYYIYYRNGKNCTAATCENSEFCWNNEVSQLICDPSCHSGFCERDGTCCSSECLDGCSNDPDESECVTCRNVSLAGQCIENCPKNTLRYINRFCVTPEECANENLIVQEKKLKIIYIQHNGECRTNCPIGFTMISLDESNLNFTCVDYREMKICEDILINDTSINSLEKGCQIVKGSLEIDLSIDDCDDYLADTLSGILSSIVEIHDFLKITGTNLVDLRFLSHLQRIRGIELESNSSLILKNNKNLRILWLPSQNISIDRGSLTIEGNPNLCSEEHCESFSIELEIKPKTYAAEIKWNSTKNLSNSLKFKLWKENEYFEEFTCDSEDAQPIQTQTTGVHKLYALEANMKYIYQMFDSNSGDASKPKHFQTAEEIIKTIFHSTTSSSITFNWKPVEQSKNQLVRYELKAFHNPPDKEFYSTQNYCVVPTYNVKKIQILQQKEHSGNFDIADFNWMNDNIKTLFQKELLNEEIRNESIGRDYIYKETLDTIFTIDDVEHFSYYYVSIRACYKQENGNVDCTSPTIFLNQTTKDFESDQIQDFTGRGLPNAMELTWDSPSRPNGVVLTFSIYFEIVGSNDMKTICLTYQQYLDGGKKKIIGNLTPGNYSITAAVRSLSGIGSQSKPIFVEVERSYFVYWIILSLAMILLILAMFVIFQVKRIRSIRKKGQNSLYATYIYNFAIELKDYETARENIELIRILGSGQFGRVFEAHLKLCHEHETSEMVAVKTVNEKASFEESNNLLKEAVVMKTFNTFHIIKLLKVVSQSEPYYVVMELMSNGDLKTFLQNNRPNGNMLVRRDGYTQYRIIPPVPHMAIQIADGMDYLAANNFVHRDLAARNCMVSSNLTIKIGDFGFTRQLHKKDYYRLRSTSLMPVRWMAPENFTGKFTSESDVFSYGIVLWEIATYGERPYDNISNENIQEFIVSGKTESKPENNCSDEIYEIMKKCWQYEPADRISFNAIIRELLTQAPDNFIENSYYSLED